MSKPTLTVVREGLASFWSVDGSAVDQVAALKVGDMRAEQIAVLSLDIGEVMERHGLVGAVERHPAGARSLPPSKPKPKELPANRKYGGNSGEANVLKAIAAHPGMTAVALTVIMFGSANRRVAVQAAINRLRAKGAIYRDGDKQGWYARDIDPVTIVRPVGRPTKNGMPGRAGKVSRKDQPYITTDDALAYIKANPGTTTAAMRDDLGIDSKTVWNRLYQLGKVKGLVEQRSNGGFYAVEAPEPEEVPT